MMTRSTGLALVALGTILLLAVNVPRGFLSLRIAGLILLVTGLTGLRVPQRACSWLRGRQDQVTESLDRLTVAGRRLLEPPLPPGLRVPLDDLLQPETRVLTPAGRRD